MKRKKQPKDQKCPSCLKLFAKSGFVGHQDACLQEQAGVKQVLAHRVVAQTILAGE